MPCDKEQKENALDDTGGHVFEARDRTALAMRHQCKFSPPQNDAGKCMGRR